MKAILRHILLFSVFFLFKNIQAQAPLNDNCENALEIQIPGKGFDLGTFSSVKVNVQLATRQVGEHCAAELEDNGNCIKTVWYKFYLPTTRSVGIKLTQNDSAIPQIFAGFNIYRIGDCSYSALDLSKQLTPLGKFGTSGNHCLAGGWYLVQVGCKKKANGDLWINLELNLPSPEKYDHYSNPQLAGTSSIFFSTQCASITSEESSAIKDSTFTKSVWLAIQISDQTTNISLKQYMQHSQNVQQVKWRIFYGNVNDDSLKSGKPFFSAESDGSYFDIVCPANGQQKYLYVQLLTLSTDNSLQLQYTRYDASNTIWNQHATALQSDLLPNQPFTPGKVDFGCMSKLANHSCKNVIPAYFTHRIKNYQKQEWQVDTFKYAGYIVLNIPIEGLLNFGYNNNNHQELIYFSFYEGDIRNSCQLQHLNDTVLTPNSSRPVLCIKPGVYTLVISSRNTNNYIEPKIELTVKPDKPKYIFPQNPEKLPDYNPASPGTFLSEYTSFSQDTSIVISNIKFTGGFIYREIFVSQDGEFEVGVPDQIEGYLLIFNGQISKGTASAIPLMNYKYKSRTSNDISAYSFGKSCMHFSKGYYTLIAWTGFDPIFDKSLPCLVRFNSIFVKPIPVCPVLNNTEPQLAYSIRGGKDVLDTVSFEGNYYYPLPGCKTCNTKTSLKPYISCSNKNKTSIQTTYHYYTFFISENASLFMANSSYELFRGDVLSNPNIIKDSNRIVSPCSEGMTICNLPGPQVYTLVIFNTGNTSVKFARHRVSVNDFADHSLDMGHVTGSVTSPMIPVTCHTNGYKNEPVLYYSSRYGTTYSIPYPDTIGMRRNSNAYRTIWFTFTVSGNSRIIVKPSLAGTFTSFIEKKTSILKYNGTYNKDFSKVLNDGLDSTFSGMETVAYKSIGFRDDSVEFYNEGCSENRYFVVFSHQTRSSWDVDYVMDYGLTLRVTNGTQTPEGDFCSNAISSTYSKNGNYTIKADNTCHTYGKSMYEETYDPAIKSTWFAIQVDSLDKFNLGMKNKKGNGLIKYNVYGGNCRGMTRIATNGDRNAYFVLNCLGKGIYFIQAICSKGKNEILEFEISIEDAKTAPCKPYDFKYPIAQFVQKGACQHNDTIQFKNLSTKGEDMEYYWYLNGNMFSTESNPVLFRTNPSVLSSNSIRLVCLNTAEMLRDTFDIEYIKDTTIYEFKAIGPKTITCNDTFTLSVSTNYSGKINYRWEDFRRVEMSRKQSFRYYFPYSVPWYVSGESDGCYFKDSVFITKPMSLKKFKDTTYCNWSPYTIKNDNDFFSIWIYDQGSNNSRTEVLPGTSFTIPKSGLFVVEYNVDKCWYMDSMQVNILPGARFVRFSEQIYTCNVPSKVLSYSKEQPTKYLWSTGDTTASITAVKSGIYRLYGPYSFCSSLEYTANLTLDKVNTDILQDTVLCKYDKLPFMNPLGSSFKVLYKMPKEDTIKMVGPVFRTIRLQRGECLVNDSADTDIFPYAGRTIDSFYCDKGIKFSMLLDGYDAKSYDWYKNNTTGRYLSTNNYGNYPVARIDPYGCKDTLIFNIFTNCEFAVYVPSAFSPNNDLHNESFGPVISGPFSKFDMVIFNTWGEIIFKTDDSEYWNGKYMGKSIQNVYGFRITVYDKNNQPYYFIGTITVLN